MQRTVAIDDRLAAKINALRLAKHGRRGLRDCLRGAFRRLGGTVSRLTRGVASRVPINRWHGRTRWIHATPRARCDRQPSSKARATRCVRSIHLASGPALAIGLGTRSWRAAMERCWLNDDQTAVGSSGWLERCEIKNLG